ncbi:MAG: hypothetical protein ACXQTP_00055 [Candidatus Methanofastidiosia archaeon]
MTDVLVSMETFGNADDQDYPFIVGISIPERGIIDQRIDNNITPIYGRMKEIVYGIEIDALYAWWWINFYCTYTARYWKENGTFEPSVKSLPRRDLCEDVKKIIPVEYMSEESFLKEFTLSNVAFALGGNRSENLEHCNRELEDIVMLLDNCDDCLKEQIKLCARRENYRKLLNLEFVYDFVRRE